MSVPLRGCRWRGVDAVQHHVHRGPNDVNHRKLARALAARSTSEEVGPERRQRPSSDLRRSPAPAKDRPSRATRLLASESTPRGDILALQPVHRSRWTACRRGSAAPPTMVLEEKVRVIGSWWRLASGPPGGVSGVAPVDSMPSKACRRCHRPRRSITAPAGPVPRSASGSWYNSIPSLPKMR